MNILYIAHRIPYPPNKGDKLRAFRHIEHLSRRHRVWCACFVDDRRDRAGLEALRSFCAEVAAVRLTIPQAMIRAGWGVARGITVTEAFYRHAAMTSLLQRLCDEIKFDAVVAFSSGVAPYALSVPAGRRILDLCDCDSQKWLAYSRFRRPPASLLYRREGRRLAILEREWTSAFDATVVATEAEAQVLRPFVQPDRIRVIGNGVDLPDAVLSQSDHQGARTPVVGFVGVMNYFPNVDAVCWFVEKCWPLIRSAMSSAEFRIVGRSPVRRVRRLARREGIRVVGEVDSVAAELSRFDVSVAPLRIARGVQNKVLEAMAMGTPVVVTPTVAAGLGAADGSHCLVGDAADPFASAVVWLLRDPSERARVGQNGRRFVASRFRWDDALRRLELVVTGQIEQCVSVQPVQYACNEDHVRPGVVAAP